MRTFAAIGFRPTRIARTLAHYGARPELIEAFVLSGMHPGLIERLCKRACAHGTRLTSPAAEARLRAALAEAMAFDARRAPLDAISGNRLHIRCLCRGTGAGPELTAAFEASGMPAADVADVLQRSVGPDGRVPKNARAELAAEIRSRLRKIP